MAIDYAPLIGGWTALTGAATVTTELQAAAAPAVLFTLAAMTVSTATNVDVTTAAIEQIIVPTGELFAINTLSQKTPSGASPPTDADEAIAAAWNVMRMLNQWTVIETSVAAIWSATQTAMTALVAANVLSSASMASRLRRWSNRASQRRRGAPTASRRPATSMT